jgi:hypothetical protein
VPSQIEPGRNWPLTRRTKQQKQEWHHFLLKTRLDFALLPYALSFVQPRANGAQPEHITTNNNADRRVKFLGSRTLVSMFVTQKLRNFPSVPRFSKLGQPPLESFADDHDGGGRIGRGWFCRSGRMQMISGDVIVSGGHPEGARGQGRMAESRRTTSKQASSRLWFGAYAIMTCGLSHH